MLKRAWTNFKPQTSNPLISSPIRGNLLVLALGTWLSEWEFSSCAFSTVLVRMSLSHDKDQRLLAPLLVPIGGGEKTEG